MSYAARGIQNEFGFTNVEIGWILSAFVIGYGLCQAPVGLAIDHWGPRRMLTAALFAWSCCTIVTALAPAHGNAASALGLFIAIRTATGVGQSAVLPAGAKIVSRWMSPAKRATGNSLFFMGIGLGGIVAPPLTVGLMLRYGWRMPFWALGTLGIAITALWRWYAEDTPELHHGVNAAELKLIRSGQEPALQHAAPAWRWKPVLRYRSVWALVMSYGVAGYPSYVFFTWFYLYIANVRRVDPAAGGYWSMMPYLAIVLLTPLGGRISDRLTARYGKRIGRAGVGMSGSLLATSLIVAGARVEDVRVAMIFLALAAGFHLFGQTPAWAAAIDLAPSRPATLFGLMNTAAQSVGAAAPVMTPLLAQKLGWTHSLDFAAGMALLAGILWFWIRPDKPLPENYIENDHERGGADRHRRRRPIPGLTL
jgi:MFS transporter, ACS family, glucarate transporter